MGPQRGFCVQGVSPSASLDGLLISRLAGHARFQLPPSQSLYPARHRGAPEVGAFIRQLRLGTLLSCRAPCSLPSPCFFVREVWAVRPGGLSGPEMGHVSTCYTRGTFLTAFSWDTACRASSPIRTELPGWSAPASALVLRGAHSLFLLPAMLLVLRLRRPGLSPCLGPDPLSMPPTVSQLLPGWGPPGGARIVGWPSVHVPALCAGDPSSSPGHRRQLLMCPP